MSSPAPNGLSVSVRYDRTIIDQVRSGKGKALKMLRDAIDANPNNGKKFFRERVVEIENGRQREKMMWVKDANSRVRRVESESREWGTFTDPLNAHVVPDRVLVQKAKSRPDATAKCNGMSLFN